MRHQRKAQRGQSLVEYGLLIGAVVLAGMLMSKYVSRAVSARIHDTYASPIDGGGLVNYTTEQYEAYYNRGNVSNVQTGNITDDYAQGATTRTGDRHATETGERNIDAADQLTADEGWLQ